MSVMKLNRVSYIMNEMRIMQVKMSVRNTLSGDENESF